MGILIITSPFCEDFGISEEVKSSLLKRSSIPVHKAPETSQNEPVSMENYDMLAQAYDAKCDECKAIGKEYKYLSKEFNEEIKKYSHERNELLNKVNLLEKENRKLTAELSKYRYFIECQKNEIEKL